jgi:hypothetical protein
MLLSPLRFSSLVSLIIAVFCADASAQSGIFYTEQEFLQRAFGESAYQQDVLWLKAEQKEVIKTILGHDYNRLRVRYNHLRQRSAWILEEIGKDQPITLGVVIDNNKIIDLVVLVFRESRGGEIRHGFFTEQFQGLTLRSDRESPVLNNHIDGITGATLSVRAAKKIATLALFFHQQIMGASEQI